MAKSKTEVVTIDKALLKKVIDGEVQFLSPAEGNAFVVHQPPLIEVNVSMLDPKDNTKAAVRATPAGHAYLAANPVAAAAPAVAGNYALISNAVLPEPKKRGNTFGSGAPTKYPFADMPLGSSFFSANTEHAKGDAVKALGSTVSSQNRKYAIETEQTKTQRRAKRNDDNELILDANGNKIIEVVTLPVLKYERKFTIRAVEAGKTYGGWTAPADGALIGRVI